MTQTYEEYLKDVVENGDSFYPKKKDLPQMKMKLGGSNGRFIYYKKRIGLNYFSTEDNSIIYIEDISENKQLTKDLNAAKFKLHLSDSVLYIDFDTDYYYILNEFERFEQFEYCQNNKQLTIALLKNDKSDIINKWITNVNLLWIKKEFKKLQNKYSIKEISTPYLSSSFNENVLNNEITIKYQEEKSNILINIKNIKSQINYSNKETKNIKP